MSAPSWYAAWAEQRSLNPHHPEGWPETERRAFVAEKIARFKARWRRYRDDGTVALYYRSGGRNALLRWVREDAAAAIAPAPARGPWELCPCHPSLGTPLRDDIGYPYWPRKRQDDDATDEEVAAFVAADPFTRSTLTPTLARALAVIERCRPKEMR